MHFEVRSLIEWANESIEGKRLSDFLQYCRDEYDKEGAEELSGEVFLTIKSNFEKKGKKS